MSGVVPICRWCWAEWASGAPPGQVSRRVGQVWADCLPMMFARHLEVASRLVQQLEGHPDSPFLAAAGAAPWSSTHHHGKRCARECDHACWSLMSSNQVLSVGVGSMRLPRAWNDSTGIERLPPRDRAWVRSQRFGLDHVSHLSIDSTALVQGGAVASPPSPTSSFSAYVRLWPPNRLIWPPPRFVHQDGGVGAAGIRTRKCCGARVQGGSVTGDHKRDGP